MCLPQSDIYRDLAALFGELCISMVEEQVDPTFVRLTRAPIHEKLPIAFFQRKYIHFIWFLTRVRLIFQS